MKRQKQASAHPVVTVLLLHRVRVENADDGAGLRLPQLSVHVVEEQQGHKHLQVVQVIQLPDAEGFALQGGMSTMFLFLNSSSGSLQRG